MQKLDFLEPGVTYTATIYADAPDAGRNPEAYLIGKRAVTGRAGNNFYSGREIEDAGGTGRPRRKADREQ